MLIRTGGQPFGQFGVRQQRLGKILSERELQWLLVTNPLNIFYLTGFRGTDGIAAIGEEGGILWVDPRYTLQAKNDARGVEVREERQGLWKALKKWIASRGRGKVGYDDVSLSARTFNGLKGITDRGKRLVPAGGLVEDLRACKDADEISKIREAGRVTAEAFEEILPEVRPGAKESDLAAEIEYRMRRKGAEGAAFDIIVASGSRGAFPHARASSKLLEKCDLVIFDLGAILHGYLADMTRTLYLGSPSRRTRNLYNAVLEAQERGLEALRDGVRAEDVDGAARNVLKRHKLERFFTHSTGHGVGLEIHEHPRLARGEKSRLVAGNVVTIEPGVYMEGVGGIRIEDTALVGEDKAEVLTPVSKTDWFLS